MKRPSKFKLLLCPLVVSLAGCGGDDGGGSAPTRLMGTPGDWREGVFAPASAFKNRCVNPRSDTRDMRGTVTDQNNWLRSWTNDTYLWFSEVMDHDPGAYSDSLDYFATLKTPATTASGQPKDKFHFTYDTNDWVALSEGGISSGYGAAFEILSPTPPRRIVVGYVEENEPAMGELQRGDEILQVDGVDVVNSDTRVEIDTLNAGLFPGDVDETHTFLVRAPDGQERVVTLVSEEVFNDPVPVVQSFGTASGNVGYLLFNDHSAVAEAKLDEAISGMAAQGIDDLILDLRYNGGGYLDIASEAAYMVANPTLTAGKVFERMEFNSKHVGVNPVTGGSITPTPFHSTRQFSGNSTLPNLALNRVYIITGPGTCSASESIINGLRGAGVQVFQIGSTTCGKPYGFYPADNCGTTYFTIQFRGENDAGFGDYSDGFSPANTGSNAGTLLPGCSVADDFNHELGDVAEGRISAALSFRASNNQSCPTATGLSDPRLSKMSYQSAPDRALWVSKPAARMNRILRRTG